MILYNMRERGALEYDKFALNILQVANAINLEEMHELKDLAHEKNSLLTSLNKVNNSYNAVVGTDKVTGLTEKAYLQSLYVNRK